MPRKTREVETETVETGPEFTSDEVSQIVAHNVKSGLLHLPADFRAETAENSDETDESAS